MSNINQSLKLLMNLTKVQSVISRRFDRLSMHGIGFSDFTILYLLSKAGGEKMRRIDLAEKIGLTASGVTRMLLPLEKIGLIKRESNERDARISYVVLTDTGRQLLEDAHTTANAVAKEIVPLDKVKNMTSLLDLLSDLGGNIN
jgi:DNA-binding MarR family transcriptional regulator